MDSASDLQGLSPDLRVEVARSLECRFGFIEQADVEIRHGEVQMRKVQAGVQLDRAAAFANHRVPVVLLKPVYGCERHMRFGQVGIELKGPAGLLPRAGIPDLGLPR